MIRLINSRRTGECHGVYVLILISTTVGNCDICGEQSNALLSLMTTKNYGANYAMWQHPLTPYRVPLKEGGEFYSVKPRPGGLIWRDWLGLIETGKSENNTELPALVVKLFNASSLKQAKVGLWGFGYDFDNMKARCWYEHHFPLLLNKKECQIPKLRLAAQTASRILSLLRSALKEAWFFRIQKVHGVISVLWISTSGTKLSIAS